MSIIIPRSVAFGDSKTGLGSVGMTLLNPDGSEHTARTTTGIYEMGGGGYGKNISFPDNWKGIIKWDSGEGSPVYAYEDYNYLEMRGAGWEENISAYSGAGYAGTYLKVLYDDWLNGGRLDLLMDAIKAKTDDLPSGLPKNVALANFEFLMVLSSDHITPATGKTLTEQISKDGGAFAACTNNSAEVSSGVYKLNLTQAEMNADVIVLKFTETNCDQRTITILTSS
jgi:hypothetical protein